MKRTPIKRSPLLARRTAVKRKRATPRRVAVDRDPAYLAWLRERRCVACAIEVTRAVDWERLPKPIPVLSDPAHGPVNGRGSKGADSGAIPLCRAHHERQHAIGWPAFEKEYGFSRKKKAAAFYALYRIVRETGEATKE